MNKKLSCWLLYFQFRWYSFSEYLIFSSAQAFPNLCVSRKVFLKYQVNWNTVCGAILDLPWHNIWLADNRVEVLNEHLSLLAVRYVPTGHPCIRVRNKDKPWFDYQWRHAFGHKQEAHLRWTRDRSQVNLEEFVRCQVMTDNETYSEAKRQFSDRNRVVLMNPIKNYNSVSGGLRKTNWYPSESKAASATLAMALLNLPCSS